MAPLVQSEMGDPHGQVSPLHRVKPTAGLEVTAQVVEL